VPKTPERLAGFDSLPVWRGFGANAQAKTVSNSVPLPLTEWGAGLFLFLIASRWLETA
jgi:hypothetical protein